MAALLADVDQVLGRRERVAADREGVGGVGELAALEDADDEDRQILDARIELEAVEGAGLLLVVVDVGVAGVPALLGQLDPALERQIDLDGAVARHGEDLAERAVLGAALDEDVGLPGRQIDREGAVGVEERLAGAVLVDAVGRGAGGAGRGEHLDAGGERSRGVLVPDPSDERRHRPLRAVEQASS